MTAAPSIQERFAEFHQRHPEVYEAMVSRARMVKERGFRGYSAKALYNIVRWHFQIQFGPDERPDFKLDDRYHSRYARLIMDREPDLDGFFEVRRLRTP